MPHRLTKAVAALRACWACGEMNDARRRYCGSCYARISF